MLIFQLDLQNQYYFELDQVSSIQDLVRKRNVLGFIVNRIFRIQISIAKYYSIETCSKQTATFDGPRCSFFIVCLELCFLFFSKSQNLKSFFFCSLHAMESS